MLPAERTPATATAAVVPTPDREPHEPSLQCHALLLPMSVAVRVTTAGVAGEYRLAPLQAPVPLAVWPLIESWVISHAVKLRKIARVPKSRLAEMYRMASQP
jgi:hypothetical protein